MAHKHPAIFPEKLVADHIKTWTNENDIVYDPFMGSGTTAKMSEILKRNWFGSEINENYYELAKERLKLLNNDKSIPLKKRPNFHSGQKQRCGAL